MPIRTQKNYYDKEDSALHGRAAVRLNYAQPPAVELFTNQTQGGKQWNEHLYW